MTQKVETVRHEGRLRVGRGWETISLIIIAVGTFLTRMLPLSFSQLPFNNDAITESQLASNVLQTGHLSAIIDGHLGAAHSSAMPAYNVIVAYAASVFGVTPFEVSQVIIAVVSVATITGIYVLGKTFSSSPRGGLTASLMALLMGTFVLTTGSAWKEAMGIGLLVFALVTFIRRSEPRFLGLCLCTLMLLPLVHHLVTVVTLMTLAYIVVWSWYYALKNRSLKQRNARDLVLLAVPSAWTAIYYVSFSLDRLQVISSPGKVLLIILAFALLCLLQILILSMRTHSKSTFAPIPGIAIIVVLVLDYFGFFFPYKPSAPLEYLFLVFSFGVALSIAWYGIEYALENLPKYRAIYPGLLLAPVTILGFGVAEGFTITSHQIIYRSFDFVDIFIFLGAGIAVSSAYHLKRARLYRAISIAIMVSLVVSFPFAYYTGQLLGVRHDTQAFEVDASLWLPVDQPDFHVVTDERLSYIMNATAGVPKEGGLAFYLTHNYSLRPNWFLAVEDSYTRTGVNAYPDGLVVIPIFNLTQLADASNVVYVGGPEGDRLQLFISTITGRGVVFPYAAPRYP